jgi:hypothetical protein
MIAALLLRFWPYIAIAALSAGLYWQIGKTATERAEKDTLIGVIDTQNGTIDRLKAESQLNEVLLVSHAGKREVIRDEVEVVRYRNREIIKQLPADDCRVIAHPDDVAGLLNSTSQD